MRKLFSTLSVGLLLLLGCTTAVAEVDPPVESIPNIDITPARELSSPIPLSYAIKELQRSWFHRLNAALDSLYAGVGATGFEGTSWRQNNQVWHFTSPPSALYETPLWPRSTMRVEFLYNGAEPEANYVYADEIVEVEDPSFDYEGAQWVCNLSKSPVSLTIDDSQTVTVLEERSVTVTKGLQIDTGVESTTTIGGEYAGASFEQQLKLSVNVQNKEETQKAQSQSKSNSETKDVNLTCEAGEDIGISIAAVRKTSTQTGAVSFAPTWGLKWTFYGDIKRNGRGPYFRQFVSPSNDGAWEGDEYAYHATFPTLTDWIQALEGHSTEWPILGEHLDKHWKGHLIEDLRDSADSELRWISLDFTANRKFDDEVDITITKFDNEQEIQDWIDLHNVPDGRVLDHGDALKSFTSDGLCSDSQLAQINTAGRLIYHVIDYAAEEKDEIVGTAVAMIKAAEC